MKVAVVIVLGYENGYWFTAGSAAFKQNQLTWSMSNKDVEKKAKQDQIVKCQEANSKKSNLSQM